jgi:hypothetical protein
MVCSSRLDCMVSGKVTTHLSQAQLIAMARRVRGSFLTLRVDYASQREPVLRGSLGGGGNVCNMHLSLSFDESHLSVLWSSPYT